MFIYHKVIISLSFLSSTNNRLIISLSFLSSTNNRLFKRHGYEGI